jgi:4-hydroxy 2-oxovalerate aldolase
MSRIYLTDTTLRDGSHTVSHQFTLDDAANIAHGLENAGVDIIEIGHGDGLIGSTINYGFAKHDDFSLVSAAASKLTTSKLAVLLLPGIGTVESLKRAQKCGAKAVRVATHVTEADMGEEHIKAAKDMGLFVVGFLMMSHMADVNRVTEEALKFESYGADVVYVTDSGGAMLQKDVFEKISALKNNLKIPIGHHAHNNLGLAVSNSMTAIEAGATYIDGCLSGLGAGAGNTPTEMLIAVMNRMGYEHGGDLYKAMDASEKILIPALKAKGIEINSQLDSLIIGYAGVYSSFLLHARRAGERFGVDVRDILMEAGSRKAVGGQEDWLIEIAVELASQKKSK